MLVNPLDRATLDKNEQTLNADVPMLVTPAGIVMLVNRVFWNIHPGTAVRPLGRFALDKYIQSWNASFPMLVTESGMDTLERPPLTTPPTVL